ncbi:MAG: anti-sigma factor family protein [Jiangellaceae bacterium]
MNDLHCSEFVELVTAFLDDALDAEDRRRVVEHLALCEGCTQYLDQFRQTIRTLGDLPAEKLSPRDRDTLLTAFRDPPG